MAGDDARIWVGGLPEQIAEDQLREEYKRYGKIENIVIHGKTGMHAFAFVQYVDRHDAEDAVAATNQAKLFGMPFVKVSWAGKGGKGGGSKGGGRRSPRRSRSRSRRRSPTPRRRSPPPRRRDSRSPPRKNGGSDRDPPWNDRRDGYRDDRRDGGWNGDYRDGGRDRRSPPPRRSRSPAGGGGGSGGGGGYGGRPGAQRPSELQGQYRVKIENLPEDMGWQELKDLGNGFAKAGKCTFSRTFRDFSGVLEFTSVDDMNYAIKELDGRRFSGNSTRLKAYEEKRGGR